MYKFLQPHPISAFLKIAFREKDVLDVVAKLELENELIEKIILNIFYDLGIYNVYPGEHHDIVHNAIITFLKTAPEIRIQERIMKHQANLRKAKQARKGS